MNRNKEDIINLYRDGFSNSDIGRLVGVSREYVRQVIATLIAENPELAIIDPYKRISTRLIYTGDGCVYLRKVSSEEISKTKTISVQGKTYNVKKIIYERAYKTELKEKEILANFCGDPDCVNPQHLLRTTQKTRGKDLDEKFNS